MVLQRKQLDQYGCKKSTIELYNTILSAILMYELVSLNVRNSSHWITNCFSYHEGHHFDDVIEIWDQLVNVGKIVVAAALLGERRFEGFDRNLHLLLKVETITEIAAVWHLWGRIEGSFSKHRTIPKRKLSLWGREVLITICWCWIH